MDMTNTRLQRKKPFPRGGKLTRKTPMKKRGKKSWAWHNTRDKLKKRFARVGITSCELRVCAECAGSEMLSFAHSMKRRFITTQQELEEVALACIPCHDTIETLPHEDMKKIVLLAINQRPVQP